jgi:hypothetical protein
LVDVLLPAEGLAYDQGQSRSLRVDSLKVCKNKDFAHSNTRSQRHQKSPFI